MGFSSQKFCTERFLFRVNIDCVFLHNNFIKNINYLPKTVNQTRYILFSYLLDFSRSLCKGAPQKVNEWWKKFFSCPIIIFSLREDRHQAAGARGHHHLSIQANHTWHPACLCSSSSSKKGAWGHKFSLNFGVVFVVIFSPTNNNRVTAVIQQRERTNKPHTCTCKHICAIELPIIRLFKV